MEATLLPEFSFPLLIPGVQKLENAVLLVSKVELVLQQRVAVAVPVLCFVHLLLC